MNGAATGQSKSVEQQHLCALRSLTDWVDQDADRRVGRRRQLLCLLAGFVLMACWAVPWAKVRWCAFGGCEQPYTFFAFPGPVAWFGMAAAGLAIAILGSRGTGAMRNIGWTCLGAAAILPAVVLGSLPLVYQVQGWEWGVVIAALGVVLGVAAIAVSLIAALRARTGPGEPE